RIGTTPGGNEGMAGMISSSTCWRRVVRLGNAQKRTTWTVTLPPASTYYWSVSALDAAYASSPCAPEQSFPGPPPTSISGIKFNDLNGNGTLDLGEPGLSGWVITATGPMTVSQHTQPMTGNYTLPNLLPGTYTVCETQQSSWVPSSPAGGCQSVT